MSGIALNCVLSNNVGLDYEDLRSEFLLSCFRYFGQKMSIFFHFTPSTSDLSYLASMKKASIISWNTLGLLAMNLP